MHFLDVDVHLARSAFLHVLLQLVNLGALAADDDPRPGGLDDYPQLVARPLDFYRAHARRLQFVFQFVLQLDVFEQQLVVVARDEPARLPGLGVAEPKSVWMNFLSHNSPVSALLSPSFCPWLWELPCAFP